MNTKIDSQPALRKAAILISTLDTPSADALLDKMPSESALLVRQMIDDLTDITAAEQDSVIREFMAAGGAGIGDSFDGVELDPSLAGKLRSPNGYADQYAAPETVLSQPPFRFLQQATADALARQLERQHPQVIAVVTAHLPPQQAADVVKRFQPKLQTDVLRRIAELDLAEQDVLRDIERELELLLSDDLRLARNRQTGLAMVSTILNAAGAQRNELLNNLSQHEGELATQLIGATVPVPEPARSTLANRSPVNRTAAVAAKHRAIRPAMGRTEVDTPDGQGARPTRTPPPGQHVRDEQQASIAEPPAARAGTGLQTEPTAAGFSSLPEVDFEELTLLGDDEWAVLIRAAEPPIVLLALTGASEQLLRRITQRLSKREAQTLRNRLQQTGPLRLSDIEHAQRNVAGLASRLAARGEIRLPERRGFAAAA